MSGIAGIWNRDGGPAAEAAIQSMLRALAHRGPDGTGIWSEGPAALGHGRLDVNPETDPQPLASASGALWLVADARVDNRQELQSQLRQLGLPPRSAADGELILRAFEAWGQDCPARIVGDFAFAIWNRDRRELFCARDAIGVKPFYYADDGRAFRWASEPAALFTAGAERRPNLKLICLYLLNQFAEAEETLAEGVFSLPAAHWLHVTAGKLTKRRYWTPDPGCRLDCRSDQEFAERFLVLFRESVRSRLRSRGPVGALLSGGLDSSAVVGTARSLLRDGTAPAVELEAHGITYGEAACDERAHIEAMASHAGVPTLLHGSEAAQAWLNFDRWRGDPDVWYFPTILDFGPALQAAQARGVRVMLDGIGGDDLLAANLAHLTDLFLEGRFAPLLRQLRQDAADLDCSAAALFVRQCLRPLAPGWIKRLTRPWRQPIPPWIDRACLRRSGAVDWLRRDHARPRLPGRARQAIWDELMGGWNNLVAMPASERFSARFGIEARHPFWDRRLVEFLLALPHEQRWQGPWRKAILRRAMQGILPESIRWRRDKAEFSAMIDREFLERQRNELAELCRSSRLAALGVLQPDRWQQFVSQWSQGTPSLQDRVTMENFVWLELWCRNTPSLLSRS